MTTVRVLMPLRLEQAPEGLAEALAASIRLLSREAQIEVTGPLWEGEGVYLARVNVNGEGELWQWQPGEPVFGREGGI